MKSLYLYMLEAVGEFGPWQARRVAVIWVFMVVLGILQKTENRMVAAPSKELDILSFKLIFRKE